MLDLAKHLNSHFGVIYIFTTVLFATATAFSIALFYLRYKKLNDERFGLSSLFHAIDHHHGLIEFALDGTVLSVNENFARLVAYDVADLIGKNHKILIGKDELSNPEYVRFWKRLSQGEYLSGEFKRLNRDGKYVWLRAVYSPIFDENNQVIKVLKFASEFTQQKLQSIETAAKLDAIDRSKGIVEFSLDGTIIALNANFCSFIGYKKEELIGRNHSILLPNEVIGSYDYVQFWQKLRDGYFLADEYKMVTKSGDDIWLNVTYNPVFDSDGKVVKIVNFCDNVTQTKISALETSAKLVAIDRSEGVIELDLMGNIINVNENFASIFDYSVDEIIGRHHTMFMDDDEVNDPSYKQLWDDLNEGKFVPGEFKRINKHGDVVYLHATYNPLFDPNQNVVKIVKYANDITEVKKISQQLKTAMRDAQEASKAKSRFLANMSHEIRTPMNGVLGVIDLLKDTQLDLAQTEMAEIISDSAHSLLNIIDDILDFSKIEAGKLEIEYSPFDLTKTVDQVAGLLDQVAFKKDVELTVFADPNLPYLLEGDALRLRQIVINLVGNAIKFSGGEGQKGKVSIQAHVLDTSEEECQFTLSVSDNGIGMSPEVQENLFKPFNQADASTTRMYGGTGLGLSIAHMLIEAMNGQISVTSEPGKGATFDVFFKFKVVQHSNVEMKAALGEKLASTAYFMCESESPLGLYGKYLTYFGNEVNYITSREEMLAKLDLLPAGNYVWVIDITKSYALAKEIATKTHRLPGVTANFMLINRGKRRHSRKYTLPYEKTAIEIDLNVLTRKNFFDTYTNAMGRTIVHDTGMPLNISMPKRNETLMNGSVKILVAEDNLANQRVIKLQLERLGFRLTMCDNGEKALERLVQSDGYDLLFTDLHMPLMDGYELTQKIREFEAETGRARIPIVALTSNIIQGEEVRCSQIGMDHFLSKPTKLELLMETIQRFVLNKETISDIGPHQPAPAILGSECVDLAVLVELLGEFDEGLISECLDSFKATATSIGERFAESYQSNDVESIKGLAHTLKSSARYIGALQLADLCEGIEMAGIKGEMPDDATVVKFQHKLEKVLGFIEGRRSKLN